MNARPRTLAEVAARSDSLEQFGRHFRDWLHELRHWSSRPRIVASLQEEPVLLAPKFIQGSVADAWLAAYAEYIATRIGTAVPVWAEGRTRVSPDPWFAAEETNAVLRLAALRDSPAPFKNRNLYTQSVDLPLNLRAGRPVKSVEDKRRTNAARQARFRARQQTELARLRASASRP